MLKSRETLNWAVQRLVCAGRRCRSLPSIEVAECLRGFEVVTRPQQQSQSVSITRQLAQ